MKLDHNSIHSFLKQQIESIMAEADLGLVGGGDSSLLMSTLKTCELGSSRKTFQIQKKNCHNMY